MLKFIKYTLSGPDKNDDVYAPENGPQLVNVLGNITPLALNYGFFSSNFLILVTGPLGYIGTKFINPEIIRCAVNRT